MKIPKTDNKVTIGTVHDFQGKYHKFAQKDMDRLLKTGDMSDIGNNHIL